MLIDFKKVLMLFPKFMLKIEFPGKRETRLKMNEQTELET
jgi:hypothetical protein